MLAIEAHPLLDVVAFTTVFSAPIAEISGNDALSRLLSLDAAAPLHTDDAVRAAVRELLRHGGYKPIGRG